MAKDLHIKMFVNVKRVQRAMKLMLFILKLFPKHWCMPQWVQDFIIWCIKKAM